MDKEMAVNDTKLLSISLYSRRYFDVFGGTFFSRTQCSSSVLAFR